jgi:hypothetical protein
MSCAAVMACRKGPPVRRGSSTRRTTEVDPRLVVGAGVLDERVSLHLGNMAGALLDDG